MKPSILSRSIATLSLAALAVATPKLHAANGDYISTAGGSWSTAGSWTPAVPGSAAGDVVNINSNIAAASTIALDGTRTVGTLLVGDFDGSHAFTLSTGTAGILNLDQTGTATALVRFGVAGVTSATAANVISAPISLVDNALFYTNLTGAQTLSGVISGAKSVTYDNDDGVTLAAPVSLQGTFTVSGANTYSGGTTIRDVRVTVGNTTALGAAASAVNIVDGGQVFANSALTLNHAFTIAGNGWQEGGTGPFGALRLDTGAIVSGAVTLSANAGIGTNSTAANGVGTVSGVVSGAFALTKRGAGTLVLSGVNTYSGGTNLDGAANSILQLNNAAAAGTGTITWTAGSFARLRVNGGVTITNPIVIPAGLTNATGVGLLEQSGTGQATYNGPITIGGAVTNGGHIVGSNTVGNEIVIGGVLTSSVQVSQRAGRVIYRGGGTGYNSLLVSDTALVGATNGIPTTTTVTLGGSLNATLNLNGFDQSLAALQLGNSSTGTLSGAVVLGGKTLSLTGELSTITSATGTAPHSITATAGGALNLAGNIVVSDSLAIDDLTIGGAVISGAGATKTGAGALFLNGVTVPGALNITAGTLATGTLGSAGSFSTGSLNLSAGTALRLKAGTGGDLITVVNPGGLLATSTTINVNQLGGILANGTYNLIKYNGASPGLGSFTLSPVGHATTSLVDTGSNIALTISGNDRVIWTGGVDGNWSAGAPANWITQTGQAATSYNEGDDVIFQDGPAGPGGSSIALSSNLSPSNVSFTNTAATTYTLAAAAAVGINGTTTLTKTGNGTTILRTANTYVGATTISAGTLELDHDVSGNVVLLGTSGVSVASGATLRLTRDDGGFTFNRNISGAGTVLIDPHTAAGTAVRDVAITGTNTGFTGLWKLSPSNVGATGLGSFRTNTQMTPTTLGSAAVQVDNGGQLWLSNNSYNNNITITGTGYAEAAGGVPVAGTGLAYGGVGAIRIDSGATLNGTLTLNGNAKIQALGGTGTIAGAVGVTNAADLLVIGGGNATGATTNILLTGTNNLGANPLNNIWINSGTSAVAPQRLNVGNGGASGTLGVGPVTLFGDTGSALLGFDRNDGYTLAAGNTITAAGTPITTFVDVETLGSGLSTGTASITLGTAVAATGGTVRVAVARNGAIMNITSGVTTGKFLNGSTLVGTTNLNAGGILNVGTLNTGVNATASGSVFNINSGGTLNADYVTAGEAANSNGIFNQAAGSTVNIISQLRLGHFATETSTYNMAGGTLTMTGASPSLTPSTSAAGGASATGDNNINALATATIVGGGIYLGIDGTGIFNQTGGTLTTNWIVLDNRADSGIAANMPDGIDRFSLSGAASILNLRSNWGLIQRNATAAVSLGGGTVRVDNTGTGTGTGANITVPLDATLDTVSATTTNLDTNGAGNAFTLTRDVRGTGTLNLLGGGKVNLSTTGVQNIAASLTGTTGLTKLGAGTTTLTGSGSAYTGAVAVNAGRLNVQNNLAASSMSVADGASLGGESTTAALNLGVTTGSNLFFNPNTAGALTGTTLAVAGTTILDFMVAPTAAGTYTALNYTTKSGAGTFTLANAAGYRVLPTITDTGSSITVAVTGTKALTWSGTGGAAWDLGTTTNWTDSTAAPDVFKTGDTVTFGDGPTTVGVTVASGVSPWKTTVNSATNNYTFTSTASGIAGPGNLEKSGASTLTLAGPNTYTGQTIVSGGTLALSAANSLGNASATNTIALSGGARLSYTAATAVDFGATRSIAIGTGGASISHNNATAATLTISGNLTGTDNLSFQSNAAGGGTFILSGDNSGYTGKMSVDAPAAVAGGLTILRLATQSAVPAGGSITLNYPAAGTGSGNATTLELPGVSLPAALTLNMTGFATAALSLRSQVTSTGNSTINGPITFTSSNAAGTTQFPVVQFSVAANSALTLNGNLTEASPGSFNALLAPNVLARGAGNTTFNGTINLPSAIFVRVDDTGITTINTTGNLWASTEVRSSSTLKLGISNALPITALMTIGQSTDAGNSILELNGFNQEVNGLTSITGNANNSRRVTNSSATLSTLTINSAVDRTFGISTGFTGGNITGNLALVKNGTSIQTIAGPANTYTGNVTVNGGTLVAGGAAASTALGNPAIAGRTVTVNGPGSLSFTTNNVYGDGRIGGNAATPNTALPATILNLGATLTSNRYNVLGPVTLNGGTLTQSTTDTGSYEGFQFKGAFTIGGTAASTISTGNARANHLDSNTLFTVADATASSASDLVVSASLRDQSGDFGSAIGGLTKAGPGTMTLSAANSYTGTTLVSAGALLVTGSISGSAVSVTGASSSLQGNGSTGAVTVQTGGTLAPGNGLGTLNTLSLALAATSNLSLELSNSNGAGQPLAADYDRVSVTGGVTLAGNIQLSLGSGINYGAAGDVFYVIVNDDAGSDAVNGTFAGFGQGSVMTVGGKSFQISYTADSTTGGSAGFSSVVGNDVALRAIPEPGSLLSLLSGLGCLAGLRRFRRR